MWYEADLDSLMTRTCLRPIPTGKINKDYALIYGIILSIISIFGLYYFSNILFHKIKNAGHFLHIENPNEFYEVSKNFFKD